MTLVSEHVLVDTIYALGLMICFYYALTAFACVWYFRAELARSARDLVFKGLFPRWSAASCSPPSSPRRSTTCGTRRVRLRLLGLRRRLGVRHRGSGCCSSAWCWMIAMERRSPAFFRGEVLTKETPALVVED
ncbi:APC family permease [Streptomyces californicus]